MKDNAIKWLTELNPFDKVKGHTKIELTDIHTGKKQIIEKDNAFQAGVLAKYMRSMGAYNNNPYANSTWAGQQIWRNLCGGIFCFRDPIDNSEDEVEYMPAGNEMVANGAYMVNNAGTPIELGSYNEVESSTSGNDSVTFVYDWMTHQGNGTISCVCLSTEIGGYIGYGNKSGVAASTRRSLTQNQSSSTLAGVPYKNKRYSFSVNNSTLKLTVTAVPTEITKGSIFDNLVESTTEVAYSEAIGGNSFKVRYIGGGKVAIFGFYSSYQYPRFPSGSTRKYLIYDIENETATVETLANNTGYEIWLETYEVCNYSILNNTLYAALIYGGSATNAKGLAIINISTGAEIAKIEGYDFSPNVESSRLICAKIAEGVYLIRCSGNAIMYDEQNDTLYKTNGNPADFAYSDTEGAFIDNSHIFKNPLLLATINNLETPVTKTAAQTMKITYTLSKASE